jgi:hypothetical protein
MVKGKMGLKCPLCGSWYSTSRETRELGILFKVGDVCNNQAMTGPDPKKASPDHPCRGILIRVEDDEDK